MSLVYTVQTSFYGFYKDADLEITFITEVWSLLLFFAGKQLHKKVLNHLNSSLGEKIKSSLWHLKIYLREYVLKGPYVAN